MAATAAPKKKPTLAEALDVLEGIFGAPPQPERIEDPLLDHLLVAVLTPHMGQPAARDALRALSGAFLDLNELRVCGLAEIEPFLSAVPAASRRQAAWDLRMALQDVYDGTHGLDLEPLRGRAPEDMRKFLKTLPNIHGGAAALLFQAAAGDDVLAFGTLEEHLLTRLGMLPRASSRDRVRAALERQVKAKDRRRFAWLCGAAAHLYEVDFDPKHPFCDLLVRVNAKELAVREAERKREEARRLAEEKKRLAEEEKQRKAEERERAKVEREHASKRPPSARRQPRPRRLRRRQPKRRSAPMPRRRPRRRRLLPRPRSRPRRRPPRLLPRPRRPPRRPSARRPRRPLPRRRRPPRRPRPRRLPRRRPRRRRQPRRRRPRRPPRRRRRPRRRRPRRRSRRRPPRRRRRRRPRPRSPRPRRPPRRRAPRRPRRGRPRASRARSRSSA